jgi:hypothetical protein
MLSFLCLRVLLVLYAIRSVSWVSGSNTGILQEYLSYTTVDGRTKGFNSVPRVVSTPLVVVFNLSSDEVFLVLAVDIFMLSKQFLFTFCHLDFTFWVVKLLHTKVSVKRNLAV